MVERIISVISAFEMSTEAFRAAVADGCGYEVLSVVLVGSVTTGEARFDGELPSDIDVLIVVDREASVEAARCCRQVMHSLNGLKAGLPRGVRLGIRTRGITELDAFQAHMASWGYDMGTYARTVYGVPIHEMLGPAVDIPDELILRNLLCQLWWAVSAPAFPGLSRAMLEFILAWCVLELVHFGLVLNGTYRVNAADRLFAVHAGRCPSWLWENRATLGEALAIRRYSIASQPQPRRLERLLKMWQIAFFEVLLHLVPRLPTLAIVPFWFPLGCREVSDAVTAILRETVAAAADPDYGARVASGLRNAPAEVCKCSPTLAYLLAMFAFGLNSLERDGGGAVCSERSGTRRRCARVARQRGAL